MARDDNEPQMERFREEALSCPIPQVVEMIGEKWAFLILRGAFNGLQHFEQFQAGLGIARNILSDRLGKLVRADILQRTQDPGDRRKVVYALTEKGEGLLPVLVSLRQWGEQWGHGTPRVLLADLDEGKPVRKVRVTAHDGRELDLKDLTWISADGETVPIRRSAAAAL